MRYPIVLIVGQAGSGKDTVANILAKEYGGARIALADPIKDLARSLFGFTDEQLWGPSELRGQTMPVPKDLTRWSLDRIYSSKRPIWHADYVKWLDNLPDRCGPSHKRRAHFKTWVETHIQGREVVSARHVLQTLGTEFGRNLYRDVWVDVALDRAQKMLSDTLNKNNLVIISDGRFRNEVLAVKKLGGSVLSIVAPDTVSSDTHQSETEQASIPDFWFDQIYVNHKKGLDILAQDMRQLRL